MKRLPIVCFLFLCAAIAFQCESENDSELVKAEILFTGQVATDGCGWLLHFNGKNYSPVNLETSYQKKNVKANVEVRYLPGEFQCGMSPDHKITQIEIINISLRTE